MRGRTYLRSVIICAATMLFCSSYATAGTWSTFDKPGAGYTCVYGIDGSNLVGHYDDGTLNGFLYNMTTKIWTTITNSIEGTWVMGIDGSNLVGQYYDASGSHGFIYTIPEPATLLLFVLGAAMVRKKRKI